MLGCWGMMNKIRAQLERGQNMWHTRVLTQHNTWMIEYANNVTDALEWNVCNGFLALHCSTRGWTPLFWQNSSCHEWKVPTLPSEIIEADKQAGLQVWAPHPLHSQRRSWTFSVCTTETWRADLVLWLPLLYVYICARSIFKYSAHVCVHLPSFDPAAVLSLFIKW